MLMPKITEDEVKKWFNEIQLSLAWRKPYEDVWDRVIDYLKGKYFDKLSDKDQICVNMVRPHVNVVIPAIYSRNPDVLVLPRRRDDYNDDLIRKRAEIMQNLLRYYLKELDIKTEVKLCILDGVLTGHSWAKTGYETEFSADNKQETLNQETIVSRVLTALGIKETPEKEDEFQLNEKIVSERPWVLRTSPYDMIVPTLSRRKEELYWIGERIILPYDQVMDNEGYDTVGLKPSVSASEIMSALRGAKYKRIDIGDKISYCILWEIWDSVTKQVHTLCEGHRRALETKDSEYTFLDSKYHPYIMLRFNEIVDEFYPQSDIEPAEPQILELNSIRTQMVEHRKRYNRRYLARPGVLGPQAKADLKAGEDGAIIELEPTAAEGVIESMLIPVIDASIPQDVYVIESRVKDDLFTILGTSDYASQASRGARTATEASIIATQSRFRVEERIDLIGQFVQRIVRNIAMIAQRYMDSEQVGNVVGLDSIYWIQIKDRREIQGEFSYDVVYGSTTPINREVENEQFMKFYMLAKDDPYYDQAKLRLQLVRKFNLENPESWLVKQIADMLESQRLVAAKKGFLLQGPANPLISTLQPGRVPSQGQGQRLPTGQPSGLPGDLGGGPEIPGGKGGTQLAGV